MNNDTVSVVNVYYICQKYAKSQKSQPLKSRGMLLISWIVIYVKFMNKCVFG